MAKSDLLTPKYSVTLLFPLPVSRKNTDPMCNEFKPVQMRHGDMITGIEKVETGGFKAAGFRTSNLAPTSTDFKTVTGSITTLKDGYFKIKVLNG